VALKHALLFCLSLTAACSKPVEKPRRTEPWPAQPSASASAAQATTSPRRFRFTPESRVRFSIPGKRGKVSGHFTGAQGTLELDPREPKNTRASLDVDLTTLVIDTEVPPGVELGGSPAVIGLQWLELGVDVPAERREQYKTARFELSSVEGPSPSAVALRRRTGFTPVTAVGTLRLHGFRAPVRLELQVSGGGSQPLSIRSGSPVVVPLAPHDVTARGSSGITDALGAARAAPWIGKSAEVELELFAAPDAP
jgi:polyisoprenoid-binding protein YceI